MKMSLHNTMQNNTYDWKFTHRLPKGKYPKVWSGLGSQLQDQGVYVISIPLVQMLFFLELSQSMDSCWFNPQQHTSYTLLKSSNCFKISLREGEIENETGHLCMRQIRSCRSGRTRTLSLQWPEFLCTANMAAPVLFSGSTLLVDSTLLCGHIPKTLGRILPLHPTSCRYGFVGFTMALVIKGSYWSGWDFLHKKDNILSKFARLSVNAHSVSSMRKSSKLEVL